MYRVLFIAVTAWLCQTTTVEARLFYQTYGSTVATASGCVWNMGQDYFVPRHCPSCRYGLYGACKQSHTTSPACRHAHPWWPSYCSPFGPCRYKWRDHVYKVHCGCTPLAACFGPWTSLYCGICRPHLARCQHRSHPLSSSGLAGSCSVACLPPQTGVDPLLEIAYLPGVEPPGIEVLGAVAADPEAVLVNNAIEEAAAAASGRAPAGSRQPLPPVGGVQLGGSAAD